MKEVSCKAFEPFERAVAGGQVPEAELLRDIAFSIVTLRDRHERIDWSSYCQLARNARRYLSLEDFETLGGTFASSTGFRIGLLVARLLFRPARFLRLMQGMEREGKEMFTCVRATSESLARDQVRITLTIDSDREACPEFFHITKGTLAALPPLLGSPRSTMNATIEEKSATYDMFVPPQEGLVRRLLRIAAMPFTATDVANALQESHEVLLERYAQLETAQATLDVQAGHLRAAHTINQALQERVDLRDTLVAITSSLLSALGAQGVKVRIDCESEGAAIVEEHLSGDICMGMSIERDVPGRDGSIGTVCVWLDFSESFDHSAATLDFVLPNILIAIENALNHDSLLCYRDALEVRVVERTQELRQTRDELAVSLEELKIAQAARETIFANINHEIRTPLAIVGLASDEAREANSEGREVVVAKRLDSIDRSVARLLRLVDGLLALAALDEGKLTLRLEPLNIEALLKAEVGAWEPLARKHSIALTFASRSDEWVHADPNELAGVVGNLLSNAVKFTPSGGTVHVKQERVNDRVEISVTDSGVGMSESFAKQAFERFSQGPQPVRPTASGSGIGLSIVREVIAAHGGTAQVSANPEGGTCFVLSIPVMKDRLQEHSFSDGTVLKLYTPLPEADEPAPELDSENAVAFRYSVLIAEDSTELRNAMIRCLSPHYRVLSAGDGQAALALAEAHLPDLLIADISMPKMDGLELTQRFVSIPENRAARALLVTAISAMDTRLAGFAAGAVDYIEKPFHPQELLARVKAQLAIRDVILQLHEVEKAASIGLLGAGLAHELRNPLNIICNGMIPLKKSLPEGTLAEGSRASVMLGLIEDAATKMFRVSNAILEFENASQLLLTPILLSTLIAEAIEAVSELDLARVEVVCAPAMTITCSGVLLLQVFSNILQNAIRAAGVAGTFGIHAREEDGMTIIQFSDNGPGIKPGERERVFEPFVTTASPGEGTGLGLAISRRVVTRHGGTLKALEVTEGCTLELRVPIGSRGGK
ncbi:MAG: response regulator [Myxococcales bacterium]|nr:response regulator [Myxococcales bacterium]